MWLPERSGGVVGEGERNLFRGKLKIQSFNYFERAATFVEIGGALT